MSMCESILTIALVCTVKYLHYCDYYYTLGNDSQSTPKLIAYFHYHLKKQQYRKYSIRHYMELIVKIYLWNYLYKELASLKNSYGVSQ